MNEHTIVNGIFAVIAIVVFVARIAKKAGGQLKPFAVDANRSEPDKPRPILPPVVRETPRIAPPPMVPAAPGFPAEAAAAFPVLDLTLPDADTPGDPAPVRRRGRSMRGTGVPGSAGWGAGAIVAMEILGPPVSLRAGATLGAPHAF
jgi:hypothetical protein